MEIEKRYSSLSVRDLLDARQAYHHHLMHRPNVIATAISLYRIRAEDWYAEHRPGGEPRPHDFPRVHGPKTLWNTVVREWSWPCLLVFVSTWRKKASFGEEPDEFVPRRLYLPDGRVVPTCVLLAEKVEERLPTPDTLQFPKSLIGGGCILASTVQGDERFGSAGCLVTDGRRTYALSNAHVVGEPGAEVFSYFRGRRERVGVAAARQLRKLPFSKAYPGWPGEGVLLNADAGLVDVDEVDRWTTQVAGLGTLESLVDLTPDTISLDLVGQPVAAFGAVTGRLEGRIEAFFYRYKSVGGVEYVADLLIAPRRENSASSRPGNSGTLWCLEESDKPDLDRKSVSSAVRYRPLALEWGAHVLGASGRSIERASAFSLATNLSTVLRELDADLVLRWNSGIPEYWGEVGHYTIGAKACQLVSTDPLGAFLRANLSRVAYRDELLDTGGFTTDPDALGFLPLADVPDTVWRRGAGSRGAIANRAHYCDMDQVHPVDGVTLLDRLFTANGGQDVDPANLHPQVFVDHFDDLLPDADDAGTLPFYVWQLYDLMVAAVDKDNGTAFLAAAGVLAHYVGDACQPLHASFLHDGFPGDDASKGVHSAFETKMLDRNAVSYLALLNSELHLDQGAPQPHGQTLVTGGRAATIRVLELIRDVRALLPPDEICRVYASDRKVATLWSLTGERSAQCAARGARVLAGLWESAWVEGGAKTTSKSAVSKKSLMKYYENKSWAKAAKLSGYAAVLGLM